MIISGSIFALFMFGSVAAQDYKVSVDNAKNSKTQPG